MEEKQTKKEVSKSGQKKVQNGQKKGMKKNEKRLILILLIILVIVIVIAVVRNNSSDETADDTTVVSSTETSIVTDEEAGEYTTVLSDGTKLNISSKLSETKTLGAIELTDIQLTESGNVTQLLATMINTSDEVEGGYVATLTLYDDEGNVLIEMKPYIEEIEPGESAQLNASAVMDYSDAYDFTITK